VFFRPPPFQFFRITHNLNTVTLMMKFCSIWALGQILHPYARDVRPARSPSLWRCSEVRWLAGWLAARSSQWIREWTASFLSLCIALPHRCSQSSPSMAQSLSPQRQGRAVLCVPFGRTVSYSLIRGLAPQRQRDGSTG
jgi:hypothetical protein